MPNDDDWLLIRIYPGTWLQSEDRPFGSSFKIKLSTERGLSAYRESACSPEQVLAGHGEDYGLVRLRVSDILALGLFVVDVPDPGDPVIGQAHVEIRSGSPDGGKQIGEPLRSTLAVLAGQEESLVRRGSAAPAIGRSGAPP